MCDDLKVDAHTRFCTVLTGFAESDYLTDAVQYGRTFGVFQQNPMYWPTATQGTLAQCAAFIAAFKADSEHHNGDPVHDAWITQRWEIPGSNWPDPGANFATAPESVNYSRRLPLIPSIINERKLS